MPDNKGIRPSIEHKDTQEYLMNNTPRNVAMAQSGITYLSPAFHLTFTLSEELLSRVRAHRKDGVSLEDAMVKAKLNDDEKDFLKAVGGLEKWMVLVTTMTPGRQRIELKLIDALASAGKIYYNVQQRGSQLTPTSPPHARKEDDW